MTLDRKKAIREYKEKPREAGILALRDTRDGSVAYIPAIHIPGEMGKFSMAQKTRNVLTLKRNMQALLDNDSIAYFELEVAERLELEPDDTMDDVKAGLDVLWETWGNR